MFPQKANFPHWGAVYSSRQVLPCNKRWRVSRICSVYSFKKNISEMNGIMGKLVSTFKWESTYTKTKYASCLHVSIPHFPMYTTAWYVCNGMYQSACQRALVKGQTSFVLSCYQWNSKTNFQPAFMNFLWESPTVVVCEDTQSSDDGERATKHNLHCNIVWR